MEAAEPGEHARRIQLAVQVHAVQSVLAGQWLPDPFQPGAGHERRGDRVRRCEAGLDMLGGRALARGLVVAAGHAVGDAEGVAQHLGARVDDARGRQRGAEMPEQRGVDPAAVDQVDFRADAETAGEFDAQQDRLAEFDARHLAAQAGHRERRGNRRGAGVQHGLVMGVVELHHVAVVAVAQRRGRRRYARPAQHACVGAAAEIDEHLQPWRNAHGGAAGDGGADVVEQFAADHGARAGGHRVPAQLPRVFDERFENRFAGNVAGRTATHV